MVLCTRLGLSVEVHHALITWLFEDNRSWHIFSFIVDQHCFSNINFLLLHLVYISFVFIGTQRKIASIGYNCNFYYRHQPQDWSFNTLLIFALRSGRGRSSPRSGSPSSRGGVSYTDRSFDTTETLDTTSNTTKASLEREVSWPIC